MRNVRILLTGSRAWLDMDTIRTALRTELLAIGRTDQPAVLVHGACEFGGADSIASRIWSEWLDKFPTMCRPEERYPAANFSTPLARNLYMVNLGADVCIAFADRWASGTGHCARAARRAGIRTVDYGVPTGREHRTGTAA